LTGWRTSEDNTTLNFKQGRFTDTEEGPLAVSNVPADPATDYRRFHSRMSLRCLSSHLHLTLSIGTEPSLDPPSAWTESHNPDR
jgi:hypothetical protein